MASSGGAHLTCRARSSSCRSRGSSRHVSPGRSCLMHVRLPFGIGVITTTFPAQFCSCIFSFPPHLLLPQLHLPNARAMAGGPCWARICTHSEQEAARVTLFQSCAQQPKQFYLLTPGKSLVRRIHPIQASSAEEHLLPGLQSKLCQKTAHTGVHNYSHVYTRGQGQSHRCQRGSRHHTHTGRNYCAEMSFQTGFFLILKLSFGEMSWKFVFSLPLYFFFLSSDFAKLLNFTIMYIGFTLGNYAIMDYFKSPILFICVCF